MKAVMTITDLTRMSGQRVCVAGYLQDKLCVRPVFRFGGLMEDWLTVAGEVVVRPFAQVEFDLFERQSSPPHTEDRIIDPNYRIQTGMLTPREQIAFLNEIQDPNVGSIFGAEIHRDLGNYVLLGQGSRSLGTIAPSRIVQVHYLMKEGGTFDYRITFIDEEGVQFRLPVTDLAFRYYLDDQRRIKESPRDVAYHMLSLLRSSTVRLRIGLARGWSQYPDRCYLQITGVYSFPDYLGGRCFVDFPGAMESRDQAFRLPFE